MVTRVMEVRTPPLYLPLNPPLYPIAKRSLDYTNTLREKLDSKRLKRGLKVLSEESTSEF